MTITLKPFDYHSPLFYEAVAIYCAVWERDEEDSTLFFRRYARMTDFIGYVALIGKQAVGMGFGTLSESGQWWHDKVATHVGTKHPALQEAWVLTELAVLPDYRNDGIGGILHDRVIYEQPHDNVLLSTQVENIAAQRFYHRRGWTMLHNGFPFRKGCQAYCIMHKDMRDVR
ncbi:MAG: GNAT family N-acetyltransferase [Chloroflexota bacterium]